MEKFIPKSKMSKKKRKEYDLKSRTYWAISPVTRLKENKKAYNRKKARRGIEYNGEPFLLAPAVAFAALMFIIKGLFMSGKDKI